MDAVVRESMEPVLRDLDRAGFGGLQVADGPTTDPEHPEATVRSPDGSTTGVLVSRSSDLAERVASTADQMQEIVIEELWRRAEPTNWPPCPRHPGTHPVRAAVRVGVAVWTCPVDDVRIARVGSL